MPVVCRANSPNRRTSPLWRHGFCDIREPEVKKKWLKKNTNIKPRNINLVKRADKQKYATTDGKPNVLIDDYKKNIVEWESKGGIGVHHTEVGKTVAELKRLGFK